MLLFFVLNIYLNINILIDNGWFRFKGVREGGITDNSSYYLFTHGDDGVINALKLEEWYNFQPVQRYKTLTVEEAEEEFGRYLFH